MKDRNVPGGEIHPRVFEQQPKVVNEWIEVPCDKCEPLVEEQIGSGAFGKGEMLQCSIPPVPRLMAKFIFEVGSFDYVIVQCPECHSVAAVYNKGGCFAIGEPPSFEAQLLEKMNKEDLYRDFVNSTDERRAQFFAFVQDGIDSPEFKGKGALEKRILAGDFKEVSTHVRDHVDVPSRWESNRMSASVAAAAQSLRHDEAERAATARQGRLVKWLLAAANFLTNRERKKLASKGKKG